MVAVVVVVVVVAVVGVVFVGLNFVVGGVEEPSLEHPRSRRGWSLPLFCGVCLTWGSVFRVFCSTTASSAT